jgi:hypothetical protein
MRAASTPLEQSDRGATEKRVTQRELPISNRHVENNGSTLMVLEVQRLIPCERETTRKGQKWENRNPKLKIGKHSIMQKIENVFALVNRVVVPCICFSEGDDVRGATSLSCLSPSVNNLSTIQLDWSGQLCETVKIVRI